MRSSIHAKSGITIEKDFAQWILDIGDGAAGGIDGKSWEEIPEDLLLDYDENPM